MQWINYFEYFRALFLQRQSKALLDNEELQVTTRFWHEKDIFAMIYYLPYGVIGLIPRPRVLIRVY